MDKLHQIASHNRLAIVGVAKNCGKTTTLNALLKMRRGPMPGLLSIGIDGEAEDVLFGTSKPSINVVSGQWLVTAQLAAQRSTARLEYIRSLNAVTPLGELFICRARTAGEVLLAGLRHRQEVIEAIQALNEEGCQAVWIDGAYGRVAGAHPSVTQAVVVSTGAIVAPSVEAVVEHTEDLISRLILTEAKEELHQEALLMSKEQGRCVLIDSKRGAIALPTRSALLGLSKLRQQWSKSAKGLAIPGLISDRVAQELLALGSGYTLLIPDGTVLHLDRRLWRRLQKSWNVRVQKTIPVVAMSFNPSSISGPGLDNKQLGQALMQRWPALTVFNPADL